MKNKGHPVFGTMRSTSSKNEKVADAISNLIAILYGEKPIPTVVDYMVMGEHINKYNEMLHNVTFGIFSAFEIEEMLSIKK